MTSRTETDATVLIHVQHLLGTGHAVRAGRIAAAFAAAGHRTHLVTGGPPLETLSAGGACAKRSWIGFNPSCCR